MSSVIGQYDPPMTLQYLLSTYQYMRHAFRLFATWFRHATMCVLHLITLNEDNNLIATYF